MHMNPSLPGTCVGGPLDGEPFNLPTGTSTGVLRGVRLHVAIAPEREQPPQWHVYDLVPQQLTNELQYRGLAGQD